MDRSLYAKCHAAMVYHITVIKLVTAAYLELGGKLKGRSGESGIKVTVADVLIKVMASAMAKYPDVNASLKDGTVYFNKSINIGFAVAIDDGMLVPVIREADRKGLEQVINGKRELILLTENGGLKREDMSGGSITLSNIGMYGIDIFTPIINSPESMILGVGQAKKRAVALDDRLEARSAMWLSLTFDHRLMDRVPAAKYLAAVKDYLEHPEMLML